MIILAGRSHVLGGDFSILRVYNERKSSVNRILVKTPLEDYMQPLIDFGISLVIVLQRMGEWVYPIMTFFSELGSEEFFFLAMPLIYWCIDSTLGLRVGFILVTSIYLNAIGKAAFAGPRPYWVSSHVRPLWAETGFGVPSGHAQNALSIWGTIASHRRRIWVTVLCVFLILMISFSRLVLGAHFPHDVVVGWLIGGALLWAFLRYWETVENWLAGKTFVVQVRIAFLVSMIFVVPGMVVYNSLTDYQLPQDWLTNALVNRLPITSGLADERASLRSQAGSHQSDCGLLHSRDFFRARIGCSVDSPKGWVSGCRSGVEAGTSVYPGIYRGLDPLAGLGRSFSSQR
ncbi:MAG: phosphatase PAP2 family protein [Chloroflexi bacterium CFX2]|nr:phosphatase PAP2 family protein [Chloroflexi bacterium CFX2]